MRLEPSFNDPDRLCPMPAGPALLDGTRWTVRMAQGDASIESPRSLLDRVASACDGTRSLTQIIDEIRPASLRPKVSGLIADLLDNGVLVDANLFTVAAQRFAWLPSPFGNAAEKAVWRQIPLRFSLAPEDSLAPDAAPLSTPLDTLVEQRHSVRTYDDTRSLDEAAMRSWLWLLAGVVKAENESRADAGPRRTIPSGGAVHALRPMLVLQRQIGRWKPGVYAVRYPAVRRVELELVRDDVAWLPRAVLHPWYLKFSTGMVFLVGDPRLGAIKYRARALQYMFIEAGAAFQNAALAAPGLGMAMSVYGGYVETAAAEGLRLGANDIVVSSAVFGRAPTHEQERQASRALHMDFEWVDSKSSTYSMPYHVGRCQLEVGGEVHVETWGRDRDPEKAFLKAAVESVERLGYRTPQGVVMGCWGDWEAALDPRSVIRYVDAQYRSPGFGLVPFDEQAVCGWVEGRSLGTGRRIKVLAEQVYISKSLKASTPGAFAGYTESNSSGCAAHVDEKLALEYALLELVERDAYLRSWLLQQPGLAMAARSLPAEVRQRVKVLEGLGCRVSLQQLPSPWASICVVYAQHESRHFTLVGAGARPGLLDAAAAAMDEMETLAYMNFNEPRVQRIRPKDARVPADHALLYTSPQYFRRADALLEPAGSVSFAKAARACGVRVPIAQRLVDAGREVVVVDIAPPRSTIDQGRTPVTVLRALVPGLLPMCFGYNREPLGSIDRFDPRGRFPHPFP
jgi:ribosomal protein S12 methylthiotransferase accessory factor